MARLFVALISVIVGMIIAAPSAAADDNVGAANAHVGGGNSYEYLNWNVDTRKTRMAINWDSNNATGIYCLDIKIDVRTNSGHYDAQVLRNCNPGHYFETDPGADGYWQEPSGWQDRTVTGYKKLVAYRINDDLTNIAQAEFIEDGDGNGNGVVWADNNVPSTNTRSVRIRTLYDNGDVASEIHELRRCPAGNVPMTGICT